MKFCYTDLSVGSFELCCSELLLPMPNTILRYLKDSCPLTYSILIPFVAFLSAILWKSNVEICSQFSVNHAYYSLDIIIKYHICIVDSHPVCFNNDSFYILTKGEVLFNFSFEHNEDLIVFPVYTQVT